MKPYSQTRTEAQELSTKVIYSFRQHKVSPNPINFIVWYEYHLKRNPALNERLDQIVSNKDGFNDGIGFRLYCDFIEGDANGSRKENLEEVFRKFLNAMVLKLTDWTSSIESQAKRLDGYVDRLDQKDIDPDEFKLITNQVLETTKTIANAQGEMHQNLIQAADYIKKLEEELKAARVDAMTDILTKLPNRRMFEGYFSEQMSNTSTPETLFLMIVDIDFFKKFNDDYGHLIGDAVLRLIANTLKQSVPDQSLVARLGGEEFVIVMPFAGKTKALETAEQCREAVSKKSMKRTDSGETIKNITISIGISDFRPGDTLDQVLERADLALYQSKQNGRNQVTYTNN